MQVRSIISIVVASAAALAASLMALIAFFEPPTALGHIYLTIQYAGTERSLVAIERHLDKVNGGHVPKRFDVLLRERFEQAQPIEREALLLFWARRSLSSRISDEVAQLDDAIINELIAIGHGVTAQQDKAALMTLAVCLHTDRVVYKPWFPAGPEASWPHFLAGDIGAIDIRSP